MFVGNGIGKLIERAVPNGRENPKFQAVYDAFVAHYGAHSRDHTKPYDGILPMLDALAAQGVKLAIVSNKIDFAVTARNAGVACCAVSWGFRSVQCLRDAGAARIAANPQELLAMLEAL